LLPEGKDKYRYLYLGNQLAEKSELLAGVRDLPIFGANPASTALRHKVTSMVVEGLPPLKGENVKSDKADNQSESGTVRLVRGPARLESAQNTPNARI
jgi:hypothetical protein